MSKNCQSSLWELNGEDKIVAFNRMMEDKYKSSVDNYLVYQRDGQKIAFLIEAKHNLTKENVSLNKISSLIKSIFAL